jgi:cell division protein ZapA
MAEQKTEVTVTVQNIEIPIKTDKESAYVQQLAEYVDERMQKVGQNAPFVTSLKIAIMAAIEISNEVFELRQKNKEIEESVRHKTEQLVGMLEEGTK